MSSKAIDVDNTPKLHCTKCSIIFITVFRLENKDVWYTDGVAKCPQCGYKKHIVKFAEG